jgi:hypothetical protein
MKNEIFLKCDCSSEVLYIEKDEEYKEFYLAIYRNYDLKEDFFRRLKNAIYYLLTGKRYSDQIVLTENKIKELKNYLETNS